MGITLVGRALASEGSEFYYMGPADECEGCRFGKVCHNLEPGVRYRVSSVREQEHGCALLEDEKVVAVEVEKVPTPAAIPKKGVLEGVTVTYSEPACRRVGCAYWRLCRPEGKKDGDKVAVVRMGGDVACPESNRLVFVDLS